VLLLGALAACTAAPAAAPVPTATPTPAVEGTDRAAAQAAVTSLAAAFPVPPGSTGASTAPARRLRRLGLESGAIDPTLTATAWWVVPRSYRAVVRWYAAHTPARTGSARYPGGRIGDQGDLYWPAGPASPAYARPVEVVGYVALSARRTAIRVDVTTAARYDRTAPTLAPDGVTSVHVSRTVDSVSGKHTSAVTVTDAGDVARLVAAFDRLRGSYAGTLPSPCGSPVGPITSYTVTYAAPGHTLVVGAGAPLCAIGRPLTLDGTELPETLADSAAYDALLARYT
jgi:hypothetical protein